MMTTVWHYNFADDIISSGLLSGYIELDINGNIINNSITWFCFDGGDGNTIRPGTYPISTTVNDLYGFGFTSSSDGFHAVSATVFEGWAVSNIPETIVSPTLKTRVGNTIAPNSLTNNGEAEIKIEYSLELSVPCTG